MRFCQRARGQMGRESEDYLGKPRSIFREIYSLCDRGLLKRHPHRTDAPDRPIRLSLVLRIRYGSVLFLTWLQWVFG
jgi:hypothetical protein